MARSMRLGAKLRLAVTVSNSTHKIRQTSIADYERKFRSAIQDCKSIAELFANIQESSVQHLEVYDALSDAVDVWMVHPEKKKKPGKKKAPKKKKGNKEDGAFQQSVLSESPEGVEELTDIGKISMYVNASVASYTREYETDVKIPLMEYQNQVSAVLRTMIAKARQSRVHLEHYENKVVSLLSQLDKLQKDQFNTVAIEKCSIKLERNQNKLNAAQSAYDNCMAGLEKCSERLDQMAFDIWPLLQSILSVEKSYTLDQMETVQSKLMGMVLELSEHSGKAIPPLATILSETMTKVQPSLSVVHSVSKKDDKLSRSAIEKKRQQAFTPQDDRALMLPSLEEFSDDQAQEDSLHCIADMPAKKDPLNLQEQQDTFEKSDTDDSVYLTEDDF